MSDTRKTPSPSRFRLRVKRIKTNSNWYYKFIVMPRLNILEAILYKLINFATFWAPLLTKTNYSRFPHLRFYHSSQWSSQCPDFLKFLSIPVFVWFSFCWFFRFCQRLDSWKCSWDILRSASRKLRGMRLKISYNWFCRFYLYQCDR